MVAPRWLNGSVFRCEGLGRTPQSACRGADYQSLLVGKDGLSDQLGEVCTWIFLFGLNTPHNPDFFFFNKYPKIWISKFPLAPCSSAGNKKQSEFHPGCFHWSSHGAPDLPNFVHLLLLFPTLLNMELGEADPWRLFHFPFLGKTRSMELGLTPLRLMVGGDLQQFPWLGLGSQTLHPCVQAAT